MAIKGINKVNNKLGGNKNMATRKINTKPTVKEELVENPYYEDFEEEILDEDFEEEIEEEVSDEELEEISDEEILDEDFEEEEIVEEKPVVNKTTKKVNKPNNKKKANTVPVVGKRKVPNIKVTPLNNLPKETATKKKLGSSKPKKEKSNKIGNVYSIDKLIENIQNALDERFEGITKKDSEVILRVVENEVYKAATQASVRLFGGIMKTKEKAACITSPANTKKDYYKTSRYELVLEKCIISEYENYAGTKDKENGVFIAEAILNKETKEYEAIEPFEIPLKEEDK